MRTIAACQSARRRAVDLRGYVSARDMLGRPCRDERDELSRIGNALTLAVARADLDDEQRDACLLFYSAMLRLDDVARAMEITKSRAQYLTDGHGRVTAKIDAILDTII